MSGILYGIGVGPGDPELLTLRAVRAIKEADVICLPKADKDKCRAYQIALPVVPELKYKKVISFEFAMTKDLDEMQAMHKEFYNKYKQLLFDGYKLAFLTIGDPTIYSTFGYIMKLAKADGIEVEVVSGITSFCGTAAASGIVISEGDENIHILSGQSDIEKDLELSGTKIIMKSGSHIKEIKEKLVEMENEGRVTVNAVIDCGMETEQLFTSATTIPDGSRYMLTIIVKDRLVNKD